MKKALVLILIAAVTAMAATKGNPFASTSGDFTFSSPYTWSTYAQYDHSEIPNGGDYKDYSGDSSEAYTAKISLTVKANTKVWLTNFVADWTKVEDLNTTFDMGGDQKYGYYTTDSNQITWSDGTQKYVTYSQTADAKAEQIISNDGKKDGAQTVTTESYFLDYFGEDATIYLVMTPRDDNGAALEDYVTTGDEITSDSVLTARWDGDGTTTDYDAAGNVKINFGVSGVAGNRTFVAVYETPGQPLPGVLVASFLALGTVFAGKRMKKRD